MLFIVMSARKQKNRNHEKKDVIMGDKTHTDLPQGGSVHTAVALRAGRQGAVEQALPSLRTYTCMARESAESREALLLGGDRSGKVRTSER